MTQSGSANYLTVDVTIKKSPDQPLGISFKQEFVPDKYQVVNIFEIFVATNRLAMPNT